MKHWNKQPTVRKRLWTRVILPPDGWVNTSQYNGWYKRGMYDALYVSLQRNPSPGKFYMTIMTKEIWFECSTDATWFLLNQ